MLVLSRKWCIFNYRKRFRSLISHLARFSKDITIMIITLALFSVLLSIMVNMFSVHLSRTPNVSSASAVTL